MKLCADIEKNKNYIFKQTENCEDIICRELLVGGKRCFVLFLKALTDELLLTKGVMAELTKVKRLTSSPCDYLIKHIIQIADVKKQNDMNTLIEELLIGSSIILIEKEKEAIIVDCDKIVARAVTEPPSGVVTRGPREGFNESYKINIALIRKRLPSTNIVVKGMTVGRCTKTHISLVYIDGIASEDVVKEITKRISEIDIDGIIDSYGLIDYLSYRKQSIFKQVGNTERPDTAVAKILEGRVAIVVDGSPTVLTLPFIIWEDFQNAEDYYTNYIRASFIRFVRLLGVALAVLLPGVYTAVQLYHYSIIPVKFLVTIANTTQGLPFAPLLEVLFIIFLFEILREASLRMPQPLGMALSIVGALILGDTAVKAGLISPPSVMIIALSGITIFTVPDQASQLYTLRFFFTLLGGMLGLYGTVLGVIFMIAYLCDFDSYGAAYLSPITPYIKSDMKDFLMRAPMPYMTKRPQAFKQKNITRQKKESEQNADNN